MHELSLAMEVVDLASREASGNNINNILSIRIEIGDICGVDADVFRSALEIASHHSILEHAEIEIIRTPGKAICRECTGEVLVTELLSVCPRCGIIPEIITGGKEFRVLSMLAE